MKKILVALDTSSMAPAVLRAGASLAKAFGATLVVARAVGLPTELPPEALSMDPDSVTGLLVKNAERDIARMCEACPEGLVVEQVVQVGTPWRVICDAADAHDVDLVVIGAHGHKLLDRVLGTTTNRVVSHTERSVHIVRPAHAGITAGA